MAALFPGAPKKIAAHHHKHHHQQQRPRSSQSGSKDMGQETRQHFREVRERMLNYVDEQQELEYYEVDLEPQSRHRSFHLRDLLDRVFADGKQAPNHRPSHSTPDPSRKQRTNPSTPVASRKNVSHHHGSARSSTPQVARRKTSAMPSTH
ncbi:unnamed protein product [Adineta steineri]|uniref:Uncharacterized protein n=1 Tax=Adineta steineri TaxID=433720 RepID=A0A819KNJ4_9BILA|nr:unnamed protein product [Adineta steineri]CAF3949083.1 unnamed protein product [Adineta steineri]